MNLGISSLGYLVDYGQIKKSNNLFNLFFEATRKCLVDSEKFNLEICELVLEPPVMFSNQKREQFIDLCNSFNIKKQLHGPFVDMCLCSQNKKVSLASVNSYVESFAIGKEISSKILTIHPGLANFLIPSLKSNNEIILVKRVKDLLNSIQNHEQVICIENMPKNANMLVFIKEIKRFFNNFEKNKISLTYDTSHFWTCEDDLAKFWNKFHDMIKNIHLVDNFNRNADTHPCLGSGKIIFKEIFNLAERYNYSGPFIIELSSANDIPESIEFIRKFL